MCARRTGCSTSHFRSTSYPVVVCRGGAKEAAGWIWRLQLLKPAELQRGSGRTSAGLHGSTGASPGHRRPRLLLCGDALDWLDRRLRPLSRYAAVRATASWWPSLRGSHQVVEQQHGAAVRRDAPKDGLCGCLTAGQPCNIATGGTGRLGGAFKRWTLSAGPPLEALRRCAGF
jgi:hypothetical protein